VIFSHYSDAASKLLQEGTRGIDVSDSLELVMVASLLYGLSLETMFRALIVQRIKPTLVDLSGLFGQGSGHNLRALAERANFAVSSDELDIMNRLTAFVEWAGRYPVAKKIEKMVVKQRQSKANTCPPTSTA
jgi:hypothetical protein